MRITDVVLLSILWALVSTPLITLYPATIALMDTVNEWDLNGTTGRIWLHFFASFKTELKKKILISIVWLIVLGSIYMNYSIYIPMDSQMDRIIVTLIFISNIISIMFFFVSGLIWSRTTQGISIKQLFSESLNFIASRPFRSVLVTFVLYFLIECIITIPVLSFLIGIPVSLLAIILNSEN